MAATLFRTAETVQNGLPTNSPGETKHEQPWASVGATLAVSLNRSAGLPTRPVGCTRGFEPGRRPALRRLGGPWSRSFSRSADSLVRESLRHLNHPRTKRSTLLCLQPCHLRLGVEFRCMVTPEIRAGAWAESSIQFFFPSPQVGLCSHRVRSSWSCLSGHRAARRDGRALGHPANRGVDDNAGEQSPNRIRRHRHYENFRRRKSLPDVPSDFRRQKSRKANGGSVPNQKTGVHHRTPGVGFCRAHPVHPCSRTN
jgi:hypothetical protein